MCVSELGTWRHFYLWVAKGGVNDAKERRLRAYSIALSLLKTIERAVSGPMQRLGGPERAGSVQGPNRGPDGGSNVKCLPNRPPSLDNIQGAQSAGSRVCQQTLRQS